MLEPDLVKTGIKGLDEVLSGGIPRGNVILLAGTAGTGKTTIGVEFVYRGASQFNEPGVIVLFEVAPDKVMRDAALFGWDLRELERTGRLKMIFTTRQLFQQELLKADSPLLAEAAEIGARRIFVDGVVRLVPALGAGLLHPAGRLGELLRRTRQVGVPHERDVPVDREPATAGRAVEHVVRPRERGVAERATEELEQGRVHV